MSMTRVTMRRIREILRLKWELKLSHRQTALSVGLSPSTVSECVGRAVAAGLNWPLAAALDDEALEARLYVTKPATVVLAVPDYAAMHQELRKKGVTLQLLWMEYRQQYGERGYQYAQFCVLYRNWRGGLDLVMRQNHQGGEKLFIDFSGLTLDIINRETGEVWQAQVFVATLGASNYTYAEVLSSQALGPWLQAHVHAFSFFEGVAGALVPDNLKSGVTHACLYDPEINPAYAELAGHYNTVVLPARARKPRDKAKVENGVLQAERWLLAPLRKQTFFCVEDANKAVGIQLKWLNNRPLSKMDGTRHSVYLEVDKPALKALPQRPYEFADWEVGVKVHDADYHVAFARNFYSVPYGLHGKRVDVRATATTVECLYRGKVVATHPRVYGRGNTYQTAPEHRPKAHRVNHDWPPERLIAWAGKVGTATAAVVERMLRERPHPEQGYRAVLGVLRLSKQYGPERLERACSRALRWQACTYRSIATCLKNGMDNQEDLVVTPKPAPSPVPHDNIRGPAYYQADEAGSPRTVGLIPEEQHHA
jgi:transposase